MAGGPESSAELMNFVQSLDRMLAQISSDSGASDGSDLSITRAQLIIMCGGGNLVRGRESRTDQVSDEGTVTDRTTDDRVANDRAGMLSTLINAIELKKIFSKYHRDAEIFSTINMDITQPYNINQIKLASTGTVIILAGGINTGFISTDTAAVVRALELGCTCAIKVTKVGGVYDKDPKMHEDAKMLSELTYSEAMSKNAFDKSAICIAEENRLPFIVMSLEHVGTYLQNQSLESGTIIS